MQKKLQRQAISLVKYVSLLGLLILFPSVNLADNGTITFDGYTPYHCTRVVDGDTIVIDMANGTLEKIRLIGVDTPETAHPTKPVECYGAEASNYTKHMVENKDVLLEYDHQDRDKYHRLLAYVWLVNGTSLNEALISEGYGRAYLKFKFRKKAQYEKLEQEARENNRGLWGKCGDGNLPKSPENGN